MKTEFTYNVVVTTDEDKGVLVEKALTEAAKKFDASANVDEVDAVEIEDDEEKDSD